MINLIPQIKYSQSLYNDHLNTIIASTSSISLSHSIKMALKKFRENSYKKREEIAFRVDYWSDGSGIVRKFGKYFGSK